ncbi:MAG: ATP-dependent helicase, partial [Candidatus Helarchaeota archaeon]|nr:ATP-dependent helicase [Candidatus Helarchaeota archaeon]
MKDKENFYMVFNNLDQSQKDAVKSKDNYMFVSGGSGTGKTRVVCCHAAYLMLEYGYKSDEILIFSGFSSSEGEIEKNIYKLVRKNYSEIYVNSFVSFCLKILKKNWNLIEGMYPNFRILSKFKRDTIIDEIIKNMSPKEYRWGFRDVKYEISEFIRFLKQNRISVQEFEDIINGGKFDKRFFYAKNVYKTYSEMLKKYGCLDFEDALLRTIEFFEDSKKSEACMNKFKKVIVDDFLEINPLQYRLVKVLADKVERIFATGNEEHVLFGFREEQTKNVMEKFLKDFPNTKIVHLETNYRSDNQILDAVDKFYNSGTQDFTKIPSSIYNCSKNLFTVAVERSIIDEAFYIGKKIKKIIGSETKSIGYDSDTNEGFTYSDFAIFLRNVNEYGFIYKQVLEHLKIPNQIEGSINISCFKALNYLLLYLRLLDNPSNDEVFRRLLSNSISGFGPIELQSLLDTSKRERKSIYDFMKDIDTGIIGFENENKKLINKVKSFIERFNLLQKFSQRLSLPEFISNVVYGVFLDGLFDDNEYPVLKRFIDIAVDYYEISSAMKWGESLKNFLKFFEENKQYLFENLEIGDEQSDTVKITSIYRSRGKEFSVVFVPLLTENNFPSDFSGERFFYVKDIENFQRSYKRFKDVELYFTNEVDFNEHITREKNLFLTALTRAKERVFLSFPNNIPAIEEV